MSKLKSLDGLFTGHHFDKIAQAKLVAELPAHAQNDDLPVKMPPIEHPLQFFLLPHRRSPVCQSEYFK